MQRRWLVVGWQFDWGHRNHHPMDACGASVWTCSQASDHINAKAYTPVTKCTGYNAGPNTANV